MSFKVIPAIMSGGAGTRLWPLSSNERPKQFHAIAGQDTMIQATATRFRNPPDTLQFLPPIIIGSEPHAALIEAQLGAVGVTPSSIILEPMGRNTAATALLAAEAAAAIDPDALVLLLPADHRISNTQAFLEAIARAAPFARERIVTFGITPERPETGYGYIQRGDALGNDVFAIARFKEKPSLPVAQELCRDGLHYWNAGIFFFAPQIVQEEFHLAPEIRDHVRTAFAQAERDTLFVRLPAAHFAQAPSHPFDIAIMEKTSRSAVAPCAIGWADVGSWAEIWKLSAPDAHGNVAQGKPSMMACADCLIVSEGVPVAVAGLKDMIVVATRDGVLVLPKDRAQDVKALLAELKQKGAV